MFGIFLTLCFLSAVGGSGKTAPPREGLRLVFEDTFQGSAINTSKWSYEVSAWGGGSEEFEVYTNEERNAYIKDGVLYMRPTLTADRFGEDFLYSGVMNVTKIWGECTDARFNGCYQVGTPDRILPPIMSAKLVSRVDFQYGRVEIEAQLPLGDWIWPALWLMPGDYKYGPWPLSGEIDMMESRCNRKYGNIGIHRMMSTLHWGPSEADDRWNMTTQGYILPEGNWADGFHLYSMDWDENGIVISADNHPVLSRPTPPGGYWKFGNFSGTDIWKNGGKDAPFDHTFHVQLNVAVGGLSVFFPDDVPNAGYPKPWCNTCSDSWRAKLRFWQARDKWWTTWHGEEVAMKIKSVRVWSR